MLEIKEVIKMRPADCKESLIELIDKLDGLDESDFFGTEGWRHYFGYED